jgi:predicted kinase
VRLLIMRGVSGSGKSTLARQLCPAEHIYSTDDQFMVGDVYVFEPHRLPMAHKATQKLVSLAMVDRAEIICVDNTNTQIWEMAPYVDLADTYGYDPELIESSTSWRFDVEELVARNTHGVPREAIKAMVARYEHGVTVEDVREFIKKAGDRT